MNKGRILIVDDQEEILDSLAAILTDEGHEVLRARDGQEALHIVQSDSPDVVFLDIWIPGIDGMQTLKAIKRINPVCSVVMMSGHGTIETAVKAIKLGATDYLEKPINLEDVLHLVQKAASARDGETGLHHGSAGVPGRLIGISQKAVTLRRGLEKAAAEGGCLWLTGEKGTGKEFLARMVHYLEGKERDDLFKLRCSDLDERSLEETILVKTVPAVRATRGKTSAPASGTLLLVRIDWLTAPLRLRLSEIFRHHRDPRTGNLTVNGRNVRIISTSTKDPESLVAEDGFPQDLVDMLAKRVIRIPTLAQRAKDIPLLVDHFLKEAVEEFDRGEIAGVDQEALARLMAYSWPGNVKELKILIEHVVMTAAGPYVTANDLLIPADDRSPIKDRDDSATRGTNSVKDSALTPAADGKVFADARPVCFPDGGASPDEPFHCQKTLRGRVVMYGQGLHSGVKTGLTLSPLAPSSGILFGHITSGDTVNAGLENVESTELSTCLKGNGAFARTIEHLMAVFHAYGLTNVLAKISGEVPIMDGSALEFCKLVESAEIIVQDEVIEEVRITEPIDLPLDSSGSKSMRVEPSDSLEVEYFLNYPPPVGKLHMIYRFEGAQHFKEQIAPARTFGFVRDMRMMDEMGLAGGGRLSNVILLDDEKVVNPPLRFPDEFVRHKILDIIGDFYLLGRPFRGKIIAKQTGHTENIAMLRLIADRIKPTPS